MPLRPKTICKHPGCGKLIDAPGYCQAHVKQDRVDSYARRKADPLYAQKQRFYASAFWQRLRRMILAAEPLCRFCAENGLVVPAKDVDHIDGNTNNNDASNLRPLCRVCHSTRTARDQSFGRSL
jgi:5-methylcytosine-specific restriction protein A